MGAHESTHVLSMKNNRPVIEITPSVHNRLIDQIVKQGSKKSDSLPVESQEDIDPGGLSSNDSEPILPLPYAKYSNPEESPWKKDNISSEEWYDLQTSHRDALATLNEDNQECSEIPQILMNSKTVVVGIGKGGLPTIETISAVQVREEMEKELSENDKFWRHKMQKLVDLNAQSVERAHNEYTKKLEELETIAPQILKPSKCNNLQYKLANCYHQSEGKVLKCSELVNQFNSCVTYEFQAKKSFSSEEFEIKKSKSI